jgi:choline dehydrogenase
MTIVESQTVNTEAITADYIIVGAGSAGSVLARRLSDDPSTTVLLVESGGDARPEAIRNPSLWPTLVGSAFDWGFHSEPQPGLAGRSLAYPRGKVLGGSSSINAVMHTRALKANFDAWVAAGATEWSYERLLPFMDASERVEGGDSGIFIAPVGSPPPFTTAVMRAMQADPRMLDVGMYDLAIHDGERFSAVEGYLDPSVRARPNLTIITNTTARRLIFDGMTCVGVEVGPGGGTSVVHASREVILAAGAIGSPQLLIVSGIGAADQVAQIGIPLLVDAPEVGQNLQDHAQGGITFSADTKGAPSLGGRLSALAYSDEVRDEPDMQYTLIGVPYHAPELAGPEHGFTVGIGLMKPESRGSIRVVSADVDVAPLIDPNFLGDAHDVERIVGGIRVARELIARSEVDSWSISEVLPGAGVTTDEELTAYARTSTGTYYHPIGTCRLGSDSRSVVDEHLRVRGVAGLRVVDASVMPSLTSRNINPTVYAIAEAAAAMIRQGQGHQ